MAESHEPSYYEIALTNRQVVVAFVILLVCLLSAFFSGVWIGRESNDRAPRSRWSGQHAPRGEAGGEERRGAELLRRAGQAGQGAGAQRRSGRRRARAAQARRRLRPCSRTSAATSRLRPRPRRRPAPPVAAPAPAAADLRPRSAGPTGAASANGRPRRLPAAAPAPAPAPRRSGADRQGCRQETREPEPRRRPRAPS